MGEQQHWLRDMRLHDHGLGVDDFMSKLSTTPARQDFLSPVRRTVIRDNNPLCCCSSFEQSISSRTVTLQQQALLYDCAAVRR